MNYTNFKILNINFTYILDYMTTLFSDIRLDIDILLTIFLIINTLLAFSIVFSICNNFDFIFFRISNYPFFLGLDFSFILNTLFRFYPLFNARKAYL